MLLRRDYQRVAEALRFLRAHLHFLYEGYSRSIEIDLWTILGSDQRMVSDPNPSQNPSMAHFKKFLSIKPLFKKLVYH